MEELLNEEKALSLTYASKDLAQSDCWISQSPTPSESTESSPSTSSSFASPADSERSYDDVPVTSNTSNFVAIKEFIDVPPTFTTCNEIFDDLVDLVDSSVLSNAASTYSFTSSPLECSAKPNSPLHLADMSSNDLYQPSSPAHRPQSLRFFKAGDCFLSPNSDLQFNPTPRSDEQAGTNDEAWLEGLDMPMLYLEDVDRILCPENCLQTPEDEEIDCMDYPNTVKKFPELTEPNKGSSHTILEECCSSSNQTSSNPSSIEDTNSDKLPCGSPRYHESRDSDDTLTCSEAEYYMTQYKIKQKAYRKRKHDARKSELFIEYSDYSDAEMSSNNAEEKRLSNRLGHRCSSKFHYQRRIANAKADADLEPWWPAKKPTPHSDEYEVSTFLKINPNDHLINTESRLCSRLKSGSEWKDNLIHFESRNGNQKRRKQLELWQFILWRLQTPAPSAFQWVNRSTGVFRIVDTHAGAREWGRYRNNRRMDYEKMARAMRFYYKDSILRKAKQQLHFQFAMHYVEWAAKTFKNRTN